MGLFNFIETFFFISLGITFVLILLLVYHFKQRLSTLEQKCDTMFEIINNLVQEVTIVRSVTNRMIQGMAFSGPMPNITQEQMPIQHIHLAKEVEVEEEENESDDDDEDASDEDDEDESEDDEDEDDEVASEVHANEIEDNEKSLFILEKPIEIIETIEIVETIVGENLDNIVEQIEMTKEDNTGNIDEVIENLEEIIDTNSEPIESTDYKNMNIQTLKTLAVSKGLVTNASKLKKNELLKLLGETI
jgi:hypothetical protein